MSKLALLAPATLVAAFSLLHCGPTMPVKATLVNCATKSPIPNAQFDRMGTITRSDANGQWVSDTLGKGHLPVDVNADGYKEGRFELAPGEAGQTVCLTPKDAK